jgi:hypothetical protein
VADLGVEGSARELRDTSKRAARSSWVEGLARYGLVAKGISYGLVGVLAIAVAVSGTGKATSRQGALAIVADEKYGPFLLVALALGFASYALWRLAEAIFDRGGEGEDAKALAKRAGYLGRALVYAGLTYICVQLLFGRHETGAREQQRRLTARVLDWPAGRWLVGAVGLVLVGVGLYNAYRAVTQKFEEKWNTGEMGPFARRWFPRVSSLGLLSRFAVFSLIGVFVVKAAYEYDPEETIGLDGALRKLLQTSYGPVLLFVVAAGLICYALFSFVEARYRRV